MFTFSPELNRNNFPAYGSTGRTAWVVAFRFAFDICLYAIFAFLCYFTQHHTLKPYRRGFYCDDESISYPFQPETIPVETLYLIIATMVLFTFGIVELLYKYGHWTRDANVWSERRNIFDLIVRFMLFVDCCMCVLLFDYLITLLTKYLAARLRPHFLAVCAPSVDLNACLIRHQYISNYTCAGGETWNVTKARLSFFSGHASLTFGIATFCALYIQVNVPFSMTVAVGKILRINGARVDVPFRIIFQALLFLGATIVAVTRVIDHYHFISDIVAGAIAGSAMATVVAVFIAQLFSKSFGASMEETNPLMNVHVTHASRHLDVDATAP